MRKKISEIVDAYRDLIRQVVATHHACNPRVPASSLEESEDELELIIDPSPETTLFDIGGIIFDLSEALGIQVNVTSSRALPERIRERILAEARPV